MENAFTAHGKARAFPHPANAVSHSSMIWPVIHIPTVPTTVNIHFSFPSWIKENKSIKKIRSTAAAHINGSRTPFSYLEKWRKSTLFPIILPRREAEDKSYCLCILSLAEPKKSSVFNPFPASFLSYLSDRVDRQQFRFGSSACSYGYIFCRSCCTAACHSLQEKSSIPVSISYCGS